LPTFGGPKIARRIPARMISPRRLSARIDCILSLRRCARRLAVHNSSKKNPSRPKKRRIDRPSSNTPSSISSPSPKSMRASTSARQRTISSRSAWNWVRASPCSGTGQEYTSALVGIGVPTPATRNAARRWDSVPASTRSSSPSTCVRSSRPPSNARRVNSPGVAGRHPGMRASAASTALMTARPPCRCSSRTSSLVNERGASVSGHSRQGEISIGFRGEGAHRGRGRRARRREARMFVGRRRGSVVVSMFPGGAAEILSRRCGCG
jgi:hypothetical protein